MKKKVELLAPAGNLEGFYGALSAGADAVYLGGEKFGARAYADNFTEEQLVGCIKYAHLWGKKVYLTVNTLMKDKEWPELYDYILPFYQAGLDGVIIQDLGVFLYIKEHFPGMELHISTQMTLTGEYGAAYMKELGACRIVPARELSLVEIKRIKEQTGLEIEAFIHGAMCYCYSGQCLFSSVLGGRSGNRGRCAQPCRLPYKVSGVSNTKDETYPLSLKDMCTIEHIDELIEAGIDSFKIEGRMKRPEYAAGVTAIYRKAIDRYYAGKDTSKLVTAKEMKELSSLYIRSKRQNGYYHKHNGADMVTMDSPAYSATDEALLTSIRANYIDKRPVMPISVYGQFIIGSPAVVTLQYQDFSVTIQGDSVAQAQKQPISEENVIKQLSKMGETVFSVEDIYISMDENAFYPLKAINELRRKAVAALENQIMLQNGLLYERHPIPKDTEEIVTIPAANRRNAISAVNQKNLRKDALTVSVTTLDQLRAVAENCSDSSIFRIYTDSDLFYAEEGTEALQMLKNLYTKTEIFLVLPYIVRFRDHAYMDRIYQVLLSDENSHLFSGCMVRCLEAYQYLRTKGYQGKICSDAGFYIWNRTTAGYWADKLDSFCLPRELNAGEQNALLKETGDFPVEKIVYGYIPMMLSAGCVLKTTGSCMFSSVDSSGVKPSKEWNYRRDLTDRYQKKFPVIANCLHCMNVIYNSVPLSLHNTFHKWSHTCRRLDFTVETRQQTTQILRFYQSLLQHKNAEPFIAEFTTGHEKHGVE